MTFTVETEQENDGRWIAEIAQIPVPWLTALHAMKPLLGLKLSAYVCLQSVSNYPFRGRRVACKVALL